MVVIRGRFGRFWPFSTKAQAYRSAGFAGSGEGEISEQAPGTSVLPGNNHNQGKIKLSCCSVGTAKHIGVDLQELDLPAVGIEHCDLK